MFKNSGAHIAPGLAEVIHNIYADENPVVLNRPFFSKQGELEKKLLNQCIDTGFVSSAGPFVRLFEQKIAQFTGALSVCALINGSAGLSTALALAGVRPGSAGSAGRSCEVITQAFTYAATVNALLNAGAMPVFIDIEPDSLGMSPDSLKDFIFNHTFINQKGVLLRPVFLFIPWVIHAELMKLPKSAMNRVFILLRMLPSHSVLFTRAGTQGFTAGPVFSALMETKPLLPGEAELLSARTRSLMIIFMSLQQMPANPAHGRQFIQCRLLITVCPI
jgi:hypothetical protein